MKTAPDKAPRLRCEIFVLTPQEKKTICVVLLALLLGLATKRYRETHPRPFPAKEIGAASQASPGLVSRSPRTPKKKARD